MLIRNGFRAATLIAYFSVGLASAQTGATQASSLAQAPSIQRDSQALALLTQSVAAMGNIPTDSVATGTVTVTAGSTNENGTIRILSRGLDQSAENISTDSIHRRTIYSHGSAAEESASNASASSLELAVTTQSLAFPLPFLARALNDSTFAVTYVGSGTLAGKTVNHLRVSHSFSNSKLQHLMTFSQREIWLDATSGLPVAASWIRKAARGREYGIPVEIMFSDYNSFGGVLYPAHMNIFLNGTPWAAIFIQNATFNNGLTDTDFPVQ